MAVVTYAVSQQGEKHKIREKPCEDYSDAGEICTDSDTFAYALVADGVSRAECGKEGAEEAGKTFVATLKQKLTEGEKPEKAVYSAMSDSCESICTLAIDKEMPVPAFATTLCAILFHPSSRTLWFANAGDSGAVAFFMDGDCKMVTKRHNGKHSNEVYPLYDYEHWEFGEVHDVASCVCLTDGLLDQWVLYDHGQAVYFPGVEPALLGSPDVPPDEEKNEWEKFLADTSRESIRARVWDDLSIAVVRSEEAVEQAKDPQFCASQWKALMEQIEKEKEKEKATQAKKPPALPPSSHHAEPPNPKKKGKKKAEKRAGKSGHNGKQAKSNESKIGNESRPAGKESLTGTGIILLIAVFLVLFIEFGKPFAG